MSNKNERNICIVYQNFAFDIRLLHCGFEDNPNHAVINRRNDRYTLSYLTEGAGYYASNSKFFEIKKGDIYLLSQNTEFSQRVNPKSHYKYNRYRTEYPVIFYIKQYAFDYIFFYTKHLNKKGIASHNKQCHT